MKHYRMLILLTTAFFATPCLNGAVSASEAFGVKPITVSPACRSQLNDIKELFSGGRMGVPVPEAGMAISVDYDATLLPLVLEYLHSPHTEVLIAACHLATAHQGNSLLVPRLAVLLDHEDEEVRTAAAFALGDIGIVDDAVARAAVAHLSVAKEGLELIGLIQLLGGYRGQAVGVASTLDDILRHKPAHRHQVCVEAVRALARYRGKCGKAKAAATLIEIVDRRLVVDDPRVKTDTAAAHRAAARCRNELRYEAVLAMGELGVATPEVVAVLTETLMDMTKIRDSLRVIPPTMRIGRDYCVEYTLAGASASTLGRLGSQAKPALPKLKELFESNRGTADDKVHIAGAIARLDEKSDEMIRFLIEWAEPAPRETEHDFISLHYHCTAAEWLGRVGPRAAPAIDVLTKGLDSKDDGLRFYAAEALWHIARRPEAVKTLAELLSCNNPSTQVSAAHVLGELGPAARPALPAVRKALNDSSPSLRGAALDAMKKILTQSSNADR